MPMMPDTHIYGQLGDATPQESPLKTLGAMMQIKEQQQIMQQRQMDTQRKMRDEEDDFAGRNALKNFQPPEAIDHLIKEGRSNAALNIAKDYYGVQAARHTEQSAQTKAAADTLGFMSQIVGSVKDDASYQTVRPQLVQAGRGMFGDAIDQMLPTQYGDGTQLQQLGRMGMSKAEQLTADHNYLNEVGDAYKNGAIVTSQYLKSIDPKLAAAAAENPNYSELSPNGLQAQAIHTEALGRRLLATRNAGEFTAALDLAKKNLAPPSVIQSFGQWQTLEPDPRLTPAQNERREMDFNHQRVGALALSVKDQTELQIQEQNATRMAESTRISQLERQLADKRADKAAERADAAGVRADRRLDLLEDREAREAARLAAGGGTGRLTADQRIDDERQIDTDAEKIDEWLTKQYENKPSLEINPKTGKPVVTGTNKTRALDFKYERLQDPEQANLKQGYIRKKVSLENRRRQLYGNKPFETAAKEAIAKGDREAYDKLAQDYTDITNGVDTLQRIAPWADKNKGVFTPQATAERQTQLSALQAKLTDTNLSRQQRADIEQQIATLIANRR